MSLIAKVKSFFGGPFDGAQEGSWRGPFSGLGEYGGSFGMDHLEDGWQRHLNVGDGAKSVPIVYAAVMAQARAVSVTYVRHKVIQKDSFHEIQTNTWVARLLRNPNSYETFSQYIQNTVAEMLFKGESLSLIIRNDRNEPVELHRVAYGNWQPHIDPETGEIFYGISETGNPMIVDKLNFVVPARDVIHFRQHTPTHPLIGQSPIAAAAMAIGINVALSSSQMAFFDQMRRPSGILSTEEKFTSEQMKQLRAAFDEQAKTFKQGGIPILTSGLKFQSLSISSQDAQLIEAQRLTIEDVSRVFGVPPPIIGDLTHATLNNAETLINHWLAIGLGSLLENIERSFDKAFRFGADQYIELSTEALLRSDFKSRIDGITKAIQGGLMTPNEGRRREGFPSVKGGDDAFLQSQMVPVSVAAKPKEPEPIPVAPPVVEPAPPEKSMDPDIVIAKLINIKNEMKRTAV